MKPTRNLAAVVETLALELFDRQLDPVLVRTRIGSAVLGAIAALKAGAPQ